MSKQTPKTQYPFNKEITKINISLESPKIVFILTDLSTDPSKFQEDLFDFIRQYVGIEIELSGSHNLISNYNPIKMFFSAKIKWTLASMEVVPANNKFTAIVQVPIE